MGFVNDYLTEEEKAEFKERAIPYAINLSWRRKEEMLGYDFYLSGSIDCTLDREEKIYLFECGRHVNEDEPDDYHFALVWDSMLKNAAVYIDLKQDMIRPKVEGEGCEVHWRMVKMNIPQNYLCNKETILKMIKEALESYGLDGNPDCTYKRIVKFNF